MMTSPWVDYEWQDRLSPEEEELDRQDILIGQLRSKVKRLTAEVEDLKRQLQERDK